MPRFANIKGSMNPFDNNRPVLSSSDRLKNKRDKTIYQAEKLRFQNKRCGDKNVKYYNNGSIRNMKSYDLQNSLTRGNALCEDCDGRGTLCNDSALYSNRNKIEMGNNSLAEFWGGGGLDQDFLSQPVQSQGNIIIQSDISGVWGPGSKTYSSYGYINNLIKIPRNLNGTGIVIDPCNNLFPDELCGSFKHNKSHIPYMRFSNLKTYLVIRGGIGIHHYNPFLPPPQGGFLASTCDDPSYNDLIGAMVVGSKEVFGQLDANQTYFTGVIKHICCVREQVLIYNNGTANSAPSTGVFPSTVPKIGIFDLFIELLYTPTKFGDTNTLSQLIKESPAPFTNIKEAPTGISNPFTFGWSSFFTDSGFTIERMINGNPIPTITYFRALTESIRIFQGSCQTNQTIGNKTKQSYMSCLENKTKKIKFT